MIPINATSSIAVPPAPMVAAIDSATIIPPRFLADSAVRAVTPASIPLAIVANENRGVQTPLAKTNTPPPAQVASVPAQQMPTPAPSVFVGNTSYLAQLLTQGGEVFGNSQFANASRAYRSVSEQSRRSALLQPLVEEEPVLLETTSEDEHSTLSLVV